VNAERTQRSGEIGKHGDIRLSHRIRKKRLHLFFMGIASSKDSCQEYIGWSWAEEVEREVGRGGEDVGQAGLHGDRSPASARSADIVWRKGRISL
jgi:hypothetical protein